MNGGSGPYGAKPCGLDYPHAAHTYPGGPALTTVRCPGYHPCGTCDGTGVLPIDVIGDVPPRCTCADSHLVDLYRVESRDAVARLCTRCGRSQA